MWWWDNKHNQDLNCWLKSIIALFTVLLVIMCVVLLVVVSNITIITKNIGLNIYYCINIKMNSVKEIDIRNCTYYWLDGMINMKNIDPKKKKIELRCNK